MTFATSEQEKFIGYASLRPFILNDEKTHLEVLEFEPRSLESDEVEIEVAACGM
jgi:D-arabinose 1-dehydrogenase-like Zn-dependent alcohol dehydrogenase